MDEKTKRLIEEGSSTDSNVDKIYVEKLAREVLCALITNPTICPEAHLGGTKMVKASFEIAERFQTEAKTRYG